MHVRTNAPGAEVASYPDPMWSWIWIAGLYVLGIGFFRWLGGIGAAAEAIQSWGRVTASRRRVTSPKT
jgi:hypothetical protein